MGVDLGNNLVSVYVSPQLKEGAIQAPVVCDRDVPFLALFLGSLITGDSLAQLPRWVRLHFEKESYWEGRMQTPGVP